MVRTRAEEYEAAARELRALSDELAASSGIVARSAPLAIVSGGLVRQAIDETLGVGVQQCLRAAGELDRVAALCTWRARVCRQFEWQWRGWEQQRERWADRHPDERGHPPASPSVPARWVLA